MFGNYLYVISIIFGTLVLQIGNGMLGPTVVLQATAAGETARYVALIPAGYGLGFLAGCFWATRLIRTIGHIRTFAVAAGLLAAIGIAMHLLPTTLGWILLRTVSGGCIALISTCADSWVGYGTPQAERGRILALYAATIKCAHFAAPALLALLATVGDSALLVAALLFALSMVPVALTRIPAPELETREPLSTRLLLTSAPSAFVACFAVGLGNNAVLNLLPIHSLAAGFTAAAALTLLTAAHIGGLALQWPVGYLSDAFDRRVAMLLALGAAAISALLFEHTAGASMTLAAAAIFLWGGCALAVYSLCLAHAVDHVEPEHIVAACATLLVTWSAGAVVGPVLLGALMTGYGPGALLWAAAACYALAGLFVAWRLVRTARRRRRKSFVNVPATSPAVTLLDPRRPAD